MEIELKIRRMHQLDGLSISAFQSCPQHSLEVPRPSRSIHYQVGIAKFPMARDLDRFDTSKSPVNPAHLSVLDRDYFLAHKRNLLLIGGSGTAGHNLGRNAVRKEKRVQFYAGEPTGVGEGGR
ncbi:ATP-binding protein [Aeromonas caviae]|uniref:ATP-binding protein n=1 Tax=Aeromonas caviae TaxID=648 RepID=UPI001377FF4A|nr:ATP-binding protein [Aeromonas caviae]NBA23573.1 ATP-binding protein [Aeromonas caviae]